VFEKIQFGRCSKLFGKKPSFLRFFGKLVSDHRLPLKILRITFVVLECLRPNLKNLRCNLHLFYTFCAVVHLNKNGIRFKCIVRHRDCNAGMLASDQVKP